MTQPHEENNARVPSSDASNADVDEVLSSSSHASVITIKENNFVSTLNGAEEGFVQEKTVKNRSGRQSVQGPSKENSYFCRICHALGWKSKLLSPCLCRGSISLVHKRCLERWLAESDSDVCEICGFKYDIQRLPRYGVLGSLWAWIFSPRNGDKRKLLLLDLSAGLLMLMISYVCTVIGGRAFVFDPSIQTSASVNPQALILTRLIQTFIISSVIILNMGVVAWAAYRFQYHFRDWYAWYRRHCVVVLLGYDEEGENGNGLRINDSLAQASASSSSTSARVVVY